MIPTAYRNEVASDAIDIERVTRDAFRKAGHTSHTEHFIVNALRRSQNLEVSIVAERAGQIVAHVAISPVTITDGSHGWFGLGPVSVAPPFQRQGIGSQLIERSLAALRKQGASGCVVLGDPLYYARFGFRPLPTLILPDVPQEYFQALCFSGVLPSGVVTYHDAFLVIS
jgi:putative acetyltransferase